MYKLLLLGVQKSFEGFHITLHYTVYPQNLFVDLILFYDTNRYT